jgi:hypothetical protein
MNKNNDSKEDNLIECYLIKKEIDKYLSNNQYDKAFYLLINVLNKLHIEYIHNFIKDYDKIALERQFIKSKL